MKNGRPKVTIWTTHYLSDALRGPDGDDKLLPRTIPEDPCSETFDPEGISDPIPPWFAIGKPLAWEPWYPVGRTSGLDEVESQRSRGLHI